MDDLRPLLILLAHLASTQAAFIWNTGGGSSMFFAIAVPIDLPTYNVFMSYNFESNRALPKTWWYRPPIFNGTNDDQEDYFDDYYDDDYGEHSHKGHKKRNQNKKKHHKLAKRQNPQSEKEGLLSSERKAAAARRRIENSMLSRTSFYEILNRKFEQHGFGTGDHCLLRLICETNSSQLGELNGVLGSLTHVLFSPSSSAHEALPDRYYSAEWQGKNDDCAQYQRKCPRSILDVISRPLVDYIAELVSNKI